MVLAYGVDPPSTRQLVTLGADAVDSVIASMASPR